MAQQRFSNMQQNQGRLMARSSLSQYPGEGQQPEYKKIRQASLFNPTSKK